MITSSGKPKWHDHWLREIYKGGKHIRFRTLRSPIRYIYLIIIIINLKVRLINNVLG